jgi:type II secretory pathway predicted ATPase ExeA
LPERVAREPPTDVFGGPPGRLVTDPRASDRVTSDSPFAPAFSRRSFLETARIADVLRRLEDGLGAREPFLLLTGEPGTGKTTIAHEAIARAEARVTAAFVAYPARTGAELLEEIVLRFGAQPADGASRPRLMASLDQRLAEIAAQGKVAWLVVDDAHALAPELLEELRLLRNAVDPSGRPFEVLLLGLPELEGRLDQPALASLRQRVSVRVRLEPLSVGETRRYLRHRVDAAGGDGAGLFPRKVCQELGQMAQGLPRRINALAAEAMRLALAAGESSVTPAHLNVAATTLWGEVPVRPALAADEDDPEEAPRKPEPAAKPLAVAAPSAEPAPAPAKPVAPTPAPAPAKAAAPMPAKPLATAPPRSPSPEPAKPASPVPPKPPVAAPSPEPAKPAPRPAPPVPHRVEAEAAPSASVTPPVPQDPKEWVKRFVGDKGPIQIGSQAMVGSVFLRDLGDPLEEGFIGAAGSPTPLPRARKLPGPLVRVRRGGVPGSGALVALLAVSLTVVAVVVLVRMHRTASHRAVHEAAVANPESAAYHRAQSVSPAPVVTTSRAPAHGVTAPPRSADPPTVSPTGRWTLEVGESIDLSSALAERDRLAAKTGFEGWVIPASEGSSGTHRIVLGIYRSRERANSAARMLVRSRTLGSVAVVPMPRRSARQ